MSSTCRVISSREGVLGAGKGSDIFQAAVFIVEAARAQRDGKVKSDLQSVVRGRSRERLRSTMHENVEKHLGKVSGETRIYLSALLSRRNPEFFAL